MPGDVASRNGYPDAVVLENIRTVPALNLLGQDAQLFEFMSYFRTIQKIAIPVAENAAGGLNDKQLWSEGNFQGKERSMHSK